MKRNSIPQLRFPEFCGEWKLAELGDVVEFQNGKPFEDYVSPGGQYNLITIDSVDIEGNLKERFKKVTQADDSLRKGDIVVVLSDIAHGYLLGLTSLIPSNGKYVLNQRMGRLRPKANDSTKFLSHYINTKQKFFRKRGQGTSQRHIYERDINQLPIYLPQPKEQQKIADLLTAVDEKVEASNKKVELLKKYKKGVMQKIFTQQIRFDKTDVSDKVSNLADLVTSFSTGLNPRKNFLLGSGNNHYVTIKNIKAGDLDFSSAELISDTAVRIISKRSKLAKDDIIMASIGNIGEAYHLRQDPEGWNINESVFAIKPDTSRIVPAYLYQYLSADSTKKYFENNSTGSSFKSIKMNELRLLKVYCPIVEEQQQIADFLTSLDDKTKAEETKLEQAKLFKKALLQRMFV